ncbi:MAG: acyltransferase, partial [Campylobacterota bacterium]|nr:acyltransferase [Campylobacterota bacterium]
MKQIIRKLMICLRECSYCGLLHVRWRLKRSAIIPHRNSYINIDKTATVSETGRLFTGIRWKKNRYMSSQMVMHANSKLLLSGEFRIYTGHTISINSGATLILGDNSYCDNGLTLACFDRIEIGDDVFIAENVTIRDSDNHTLDGDKPSSPIKIGDNVWIGVNVTILKGVTIGDGAVVAAGSIVTSDVLSGALVSGFPATVV